MGRTIGKSAIEVMRKRFPKKASEIETYADAFDVLAEEVKNGGGGGGSITVDTEITENGKNPVTGGAIYSALNAVNNDFVVTFTVSMDGGSPTISTETKVTEIVAAARAGKNVYALADAGLYVQKMPLTAYGNGTSGDGLVGFGFVIPDSGSSKSSISSAIGTADINDGVETDTWTIYTE